MAEDRVPQTDSEIEHEIDGKEGEPSDKSKSSDLTKDACDRRESFPIVGVGASAGGLEAFKQLLEHLPVNTGMAFALVQHLAPGNESMLPEILSRSTKMPVRKAENDMRVEPNHIYVIPPDAKMTIDKGILKIEVSDNRARAIDEFFVSLANDVKEQAIGVILSGAGTDGTKGLMAIKAEGGITFAQDEETAKFPDMPHSATAANCVDFVLASQKIAEELSRLSSNPHLYLTELKKKA